MSDGVATLVVPVKDSEEFLEIAVDELPDDSEMILEILQGEQAPLSVWIRAALVYLNKGLDKAFLEILDKATEVGHSDAYLRQKHDRIAVLNVLAAYKMQQAKRTKDKRQRQEYFSEATGLYNKADGIDIKEEITWVGKGALYLQKSDKDRALREFDMVLNWKPESTPALLGRACALFQKSQYAEALKCYVKVLQTNPAAPASVRLGLGLCYFNMNRVAMAEKCFKRVLQLEPDNVEANVALGILDYNRGTPGSVKEGTEKFSKAYKCNPQHARTLNYLANHFFYRKEYAKVQSLAEQALAATDVAKIKGESYFHLARNEQVQGHYDAAFELFGKAVYHWPSFPLAQYGLAQMCVAKGNSAKAIKLLQQVLKQVPDNFEAMKMLASLYVGTSHEDLSRQYLRRITELYPTDWESWIELGQLEVKAKPLKALAAFDSAARLIQKARAKDGDENSAASVPTELLNNIAVLKHRTGDYENAEKVYVEAITRSEKQVADFAKENITTTFNLAKLYEDMQRPKEAEFLYSGILKEHPTYVDCFLRLGCISRARGEMDAAKDWFSSVFNVDENHAGAWSMLGKLHMKKGEWKQAQHKFEHILKTVSKKDAFALLAMGNIYFSARKDRKESKERSAKNLQFAMDHYLSVLKRQKNNVYAVSGLGVVLAEKGKLDEARMCFMRVAEATASGVEVPNVWTNLANVYMLQGSYANAITLYKQCQEKFYDNQSAEVFLLLANAHYQLGDLETTLSFLEKGEAIAAEDATLTYNRAIVLKTFASQLVRKKDHSQSLPAEVELAIERANEAKKLFETLAESGKEEKGRLYSANKCATLRDYCTELVKALDTLLTKAKKRHEESIRKKEEHRAMAESLREASEKKAREEIEKLADEKKARDEKAQLDLEKLEQVKQTWVEVDTAPRKRKRQDFVDSDSDDDQPAEANGEDDDGKKKKKKASKKKAPPKKKRKTSEKEEADAEDSDLPDDDMDDFDDWEAMRDARNPALKKLSEKIKQAEEDTKNKQKTRGSRRSRKPTLDVSDKEESEDDDEATKEEVEKESVRKQIESLVAEVPEDKLSSVTLKVIKSMAEDKDIDTSLIRKHKALARELARELVVSRLPKE